MTISYYDVNLKKMEEQDKELVRYWRNHEIIKGKMEYRLNITRAQHHEWFLKMSDFKESYSFIIEHNEIPVGLVYTSIKNRICTGGMFIWHQSALGTHIPVVVSKMTTEMAFFLLNAHLSEIKILKDNKSAVNFNKWFGYEISSRKNESITSDYYELNKRNFEKRRSNINNYLFTLFTHESTIKFIFEQDEIDTEMDTFFSKKIDTAKSKGIYLFERTSYNTI